MTKYSTASQRYARRPDRSLPAIWRGIGCLLMVFVPFMSYAFAVVTMQLAIDQKWPVPYQLLGYPILPPSLTGNAFLFPLVSFIQSQENLYGILLVTLLYVVFIGAVLSYGYALIYKYVGPPPLGPLDAPPPKKVAKAYKR